MNAAAINSNFEIASFSVSQLSLLHSPMLILRSYANAMVVNARTWFTTTRRRDELDGLLQGFDTSIFNEATKPFDKHQLGIVRHVASMGAPEFHNKNSNDDDHPLHRSIAILNQPAGLT